MSARERCAPLRQLAAGYRKGCGCPSHPGLKDFAGRRFGMHRWKCLCDCGKWAAQITFQGKTYYLGSCSDKNEAVKARERGEELHDDFLAWYYANYPPDRKHRTGWITAARA